MSLADELEGLIAKSKFQNGNASSVKLLQDALEVLGFVATNKDAILTALRAQEKASNDEKFAEWLRREMPPGTVIGDPDWWWPKIIRALKEPA